MNEESQKYNFNVFQQIVNKLLINSAFINNIGLMNGKMGIAIFFAHLFKKTNDHFFEKIFDMLIDEVFDGITITTTPDFEDGLAGIGWGIEYLVEKGFIGAYSDEVLETLDRKIGQILPYDVDNIGLLTGYCGYGLYLVKRIKNGPANREKVKREELDRLMELVIVGIDKAINNGKIELVEPSKFDLTWDVLVLLLFAKEISSLENYGFWATNHKQIFNDLAYLLPENRIAVDILYGKQLTQRDYFLSQKLNGKDISTASDDFLRFCALLCLFCEGKGRDDFFVIKDFLSFKLISYEECEWPNYVDWKDSKELGFHYGLCGICFSFLAENILNSKQINKRIVNATKPLLSHPFGGKSKIKVVFIPYDFSGAATYAEELLCYFDGRQDLEVYVLYINWSIEEYSVEKTKSFVIIKVPIITSFSEACEEIQHGYFLRVTQILQNDFLIPDGTIFHFNHCDYFKNFIPLVKSELHSINLLTYHFVHKQATICEFICRTCNSLDNVNEDLIFLKNYNPHNFDSIICVSYFAQKILTEYYNIPFEKTTVIWNGTSSWKSGNNSNNEKNELKKYFGLDPQKKVILFVGRLEQRKGIEELLDVAEKLCKRYNDLHFVFSGNGKFEDYLYLCKSFLSSVSFTGNICKEDIQRLYQLAEIGIVPSRWEIFGYVPIEMMHSKLPVIATNVPGMNEIFKLFSPEEYLVEVEISHNDLCVNKSNLYEKICFFLDNPVKLNDHASDGLSCACEFFKREDMGEKTVKYYYKISSI